MASYIQEVGQTTTGTYSSDRDFDYLLKIVIVGPSGSGKSNLLLRYCDNSFSHHFISTIGVDFRFKDVEIENDETNTRDRVKLQLWDTAGQERFRSVVRSFYRGCHGVFLVFDLTSRASFESIDNVWMEEVNKYAEAGVNLILVGNKNDLETEREVSREAAQAYANENGMTYFETSAKTGDEVESTFESMALQLHGKRHTLPSLSKKKLDVTGGGEEVDGSGKRKRDQQNCCVIL